MAAPSFDGGRFLATQTGDSVGAASRWPVGVAWDSYCPWPEGILHRQTFEQAVVLRFGKHHATTGPDCAS